jgi:hypothetical protein
MLASSRGSGVKPIVLLDYGSHVFDMDGFPLVSIGRMLVAGLGGTPVME